MSEGYDPSEDMTDGEDLSTAGGALTSTPASLAVDAGDPYGDSPVAALRQATARLKAQRSGLSGNEKLAALLIGYGKPTQSGSWQSSVSNAAQTLLAQQMAQKKADEQRQDLITKYDLAAAHYGAQSDASAARTKELADAARLRAQATTAKEARGTIQVLPSMWNGAPVRAVLKGFNPDGTPFTREVPVGTPGSTQVSSGAPGTASNPFPVQHGTGADLMAKYPDVKGMDPKLNYALPITGPEAGKFTEDKSDDYLAPYGDANGPQLLNQLSAGDRAQVDAIAHGKIAPPTAGTRSTAAQRILALAAAAYPGVDFAKNYRTTIDYAPSGKSGQNIVKGGTAINHAVKLFDSVDALDNVDWGPLSGTVNGMKNAIQASNNPAVKVFRDNRDIFVNELEAAIKGTGNATSLQAFREWQKTLNDADSPDVIKAVLRRGVGLLGERLQEQVQPYNATLGTNRSFLSWLPQSAQAAFTKVNPDYDLTDDDKAYLVDQERDRRAAKAARAAPGPSSATGGKALPATTLGQYKLIPEANKAAARAHLQELGYDTSSLK